MRKTAPAVCLAVLVFAIMGGCASMSGAYCWDDHMAIPCYQGRWECEEQPGDPCEICVCEPFEWNEGGPSPYP